jgi:thymidylate synthase (FAD)
VNPIPVMNGFVRLDAVCADDISVVNSARVSFGRRTDVLDSSGEGLIRFLMREKHGTPFEHNFFRFHVRCPIFVTREWFRHRIGWSYNEFSGRYAEMPDDAWIPDLDAVRSQVGKPGNYTFEQMDVDTAREVAATIADANGHAYRTYRYLLQQGVAKEVARSVLPVGSYTEFYASCNARSLMNFCALRNAPAAQREIRLYAEVLEDVFAQHMPVTADAWKVNGRVAP